MKNLRLIIVLLSAMLSQIVMAYGSHDERISSYLKLLNSNNYAAQEQMLNRLQWSGLSDPALFDAVEQRLLAHYQDDAVNSDLKDLMNYYVRALGYSGNEKYRSTIIEVSHNAVDSKLRKHGSKALSDLSKFSQWLSLLPSDITPVEGQSIESATYMAMLNVDNTFVQRLAARAIFHERNNDAALLDKAAEIIRKNFMDTGLDAQTQDTIAWLCKDLGQNAQKEYFSLLSEVAEKSPSRKIAKYAAKYIN